MSYLGFVYNYSILVSTIGKSSIFFFIKNYLNIYTNLPSYFLFILVSIGTGGTYFKSLIENLANMDY